MSDNKMDKVEVGKVIEIPIEGSGFKQVIQSEKWPSANIMQMCPNEFSDVIKKHYMKNNKIESEQEFEEESNLYKSTNCMVNEVDGKSKKIDLRWLLVSNPNEIEINEQSIITEKYQPIVSPTEEKLKAEFIFLTAAALSSNFFCSSLSR